MNYETLKLNMENNDRVLRITINRPEVRNAFNATLIKELHNVFTEIVPGKNDPYTKLRVVLLEGAGKAFCAGGDLNWMKSGLDMTEAENFEDCRFLTEMFTVMDQSPKPLIGVVHGYAIGGGVGLTSVCDHVIAEKETVFSLSEVKLGLVPACIGPFVLSKIGLSRARSLFISGERFKAKYAKKLGLVHEVADGSGDLQQKSEAAVGRVLEGGPYAIACAKNLLQTLYWKMQDKPLSEQLKFAAAELARLRAGDEGQEGVKAFLEKRSPEWRNG